MINKTKQERLEMYKIATEKWGWVAQIDQAIEEMAELIIALNKRKRNILYKEKTNKDKINENLYTELADVSICLEQMIEHFGKDNVDKKVNSQLEKFQNQINKKSKRN